MTTPQQRVLVTGGSGFIAGHCILQLLEQGHLVRTTVRSLAKQDTVRAVLTDAGLVHGEHLTFVAADLTDDAGWAEAVAGCDVVLHVASPVAPGHVGNEDDVVRPAREGTLRVLRAARDGGVRRVVLTSAFHAVGFGHPRTDHTFTEDDWSVLDGPGMDPYGRSKTLAERAAWEFVEGGDLELTTMLPVAVVGPVLGRDISGSNQLVRRMLAGALPGYPDIAIPVVDVRDMASAHVSAMTAPDAAGRRFLLSTGDAIPMRRIGAILREQLGDAASRVPTRTIPNLVVRAGALFSTELRTAAAELGHVKKVSNERARQRLDWRPRDPQEAIVAAGRSLVERSLVTTT